MIVSSLASATDDGSDAVFGQRVFVTFAHGTLMLLDPWGPVVWSGVPSAADERPLSTTRRPSSGETAASFAAERSRAVAAAVEQLLARPGAGEAVPWQQRAYLETVARNWERARAAVRGAAG